MLTLYRRHNKGCHGKKSRRGVDLCSCPLWIRGSYQGETLRQSLYAFDITSLEAAEAWREKWKAQARGEGESVAKEARAKIADATERFLADAKARSLHEASIYKYTLLLRRLKEFAEKNRLECLDQLGPDTLSRFRESWVGGACTRGKKLELLRAFFRFCMERKWIADNPARFLKTPRVTLKPTLPFDSAEMIRILAACETLYAQTSKNGKENARRLPGLVLLMRFGGLRIGDAASLRCDRIDAKGRLFLYCAKTGTPVSVVLPPHVIDVLNKTPRATPERFFWNAKCKLETNTKVWDTRLRRLFRLANVPDGHSHRFRDSFAVELLLAGVPMERLSILLGHSSIRITERHYAPWIRSRQEQLEADVSNAWKDDALLAALGTKAYSPQSRRVN
jgi:integrase/recombinase XerD